MPADACSYLRLCGSELFDDLPSFLQGMLQSGVFGTDQAKFAERLQQGELSDKHCLLLSKADCPSEMLCLGKSARKAFRCAQSLFLAGQAQFSHS